MTDRKPPGVSFETWVDKQIREAEERDGPPLDLAPFDVEKIVAEWHEHRQDG